MTKSASEFPLEFSKFLKLKKFFLLVNTAFDPLPVLGGVYLSSQAKYTLGFMNFTRAWRQIEV